MFIFKDYFLFLKPYTIKENLDITIISVLIYVFWNLALWSHVILKFFNFIITGVYNEKCVGNEADEYGKAP